MPRGMMRRFPGIRMSPFSPIGKNPMTRFTRFQNLDVQNGNKTTFASRYATNVTSGLEYRGERLAGIDTGDFTTTQLDRYNSLVDLNATRQENWANTTSGLNVTV
ncbi:MAG: hypothetical protein HRT47_02565 [Candidatus Caenarcaniphilales bacterium]|nr:hypothetical protein [Candidatus Caenarcaniphilales bacterium]